MKRLFLTKIFLSTLLLLTSSYSRVVIPHEYFKPEYKNKGEEKNDALMQDIFCEYDQYDSVNTLLADECYKTPFDRTLLTLHSALTNAILGAGLTGSVIPIATKPPINLWPLWGALNCRNCTIGGSTEEETSQDESTDEEEEQDDPPRPPQKPIRPPIEPPKPPSEDTRTTIKTEILALNCKFRPIRHKLYFALGDQDSQLDNFVQKWGTNTKPRLLPTQRQQRFSGCRYKRSDIQSAQARVSQKPGSQFTPLPYNNRLTIDATKGRNALFAVERITITTKTQMGQTIITIQDHLLHPTQLNYRPIGNHGNDTFVFGANNALFAYRDNTSDINVKPRVYQFKVCYFMQCSEKKGRITLRLANPYTDGPGFSFYYSSILNTLGLLTPLDDTDPWKITVWDAFDGQGIQIGIIERYFAQETIETFNKINVNTPLRGSTLNNSVLYRYYKLRDTGSLIGSSIRPFKFTTPYIYLSNFGDDKEGKNHALKVSAVAAEISQADIIPIHFKNIHQAFNQELDIYNLSFSTPHSIPHFHESSIVISSTGNHAFKHLVYDVSTPLIFYINKLEDQQNYPHTFLSTNGKNYKNESGSSFSSPRISAIISLLQQYYKEQTGQKLDYKTLRFLLAISAINRQGISPITSNESYGLMWDGHKGYGTINAQQLFKNTYQWLTHHTIQNFNTEFLEYSIQTKTLINNTTSTPIPSKSEFSYSYSLENPLKLDSLILDITFDPSLLNILNHQEAYGMDITLNVQKNLAENQKNYTVPIASNTINITNILNTQKKHLNTINLKIEAFYLHSLQQGDTITLTINNQLNQTVHVKKIELNANHYYTDIIPI